MGAHPGRTLAVLVVVAAVALAAIGVVGVVAPEAQPVILVAGAVAYLITIPVIYVIQLRRHW